MNYLGRDPEFIEPPDDPPWADRPADWRESDVVKQAREMLTNFDAPNRACLTENDWENVLRGVLDERDFIGGWLQRCLDAEYQRTSAAEGGDVTHFYVYVIAFDQDVFGIFSTREAAEADRQRQIEQGGPAWRDCKVERWRVEGEPERASGPKEGECG